MFCPQITIKQLVEKFLMLEQGNMIVRKYTDKFGFVEFYVAIEESRVERYIWGWTIPFYESVEIQKPKTFHSIVEVMEGQEWENNRQGENRD